MLEFGREGQERNTLKDHCFGQEAHGLVEVPNRALLVEFCESNSLVVANTFHRSDDSKKVTFMEAGAPPLGVVTPRDYNMLDLLLCSESYLPCLKLLESTREAALATDHFLVRCSLADLVLPNAPRQ